VVVGIIDCLRVKVKCPPVVFLLMRFANAKSDYAISAFEVEVGTSVAIRRAGITLTRELLFRLHG